MPKNKRESLIYTLMMCFVMVLWMRIYNVGLHSGEVSLSVLKASWLGMPLAYCCALVLDWSIKNGHDRFYLYGPANGFFHVIIWCY